MTSRGAKNRFSRKQKAIILTSTKALDAQVTRQNKVDSLPLEKAKKAEILWGNRFVFQGSSYQCINASLLAFSTLRVPWSKLFIMIFLWGIFNGCCWTEMPSIALLLAQRMMMMNAGIPTQFFHCFLTLGLAIQREEKVAGKI